MGTEEKYGHSMDADPDAVTQAGQSPDAEHEAGAHAHDHTHTHTHKYTHSHTHTHTHSHTHTHKNTKAVLDRLARAIGHLEKVRLMVEDGEDCSAVLIQLSAVKSAINNTGKLILKDHMEHCMVEAVEEGDFGAIEELTRAIDQFVK